MRLCYRGLWALLPAQPFLSPPTHLIQSHSFAFSAMLGAQPLFFDNGKQDKRERVVRGKAMTIVLQGPSGMLLQTDFDASMLPTSCRKRTGNVAANRLRPPCPVTVSPKSSKGALPCRTVYPASCDRLFRLAKANIIRYDMMVFTSNRHP